ncbi:MAG: flippase [Bacteroidota bacterium]
MKIATILNKSEGIKKYFFNTFWLFAEQAQKLVLAFAVGVFVARYLGPTEYGKFSYAQGFVGLFAVLSQMGLNSIVVRDIVRKRYDNQELLGAAWLLQFLGGILTLSISSLGLLFLNAGVEVKYMVVLIASAEIAKSLNVIKLYFEANVKTKYLAKVSLFQSLLTAVVKILLIVFKANVIWFGFVVLLDASFAAVGLIIVYRIAEGKISHWTIKKYTLVRLLKDSWPMIFYGLALQIQAKIDQVMLGNMVGEEEVGYYSVALKIIEIFVMFPFVLVKSLAPSITEAKEKSKELYERRLLNLYRLFFLIFLVYGGTIYLVSEPMIVIVYGEEFREAGILLSLFAIRLLFNCMGIAKSTFITNESLFHHGMIAAIVGAIVNISANYYLIPLYQSRGAIIATIISFTTFVFLIDVVNPRTRNNLRLMIKGMFTFFLLKKV